MKITKIGILSAAKIQGTILGLFGLCAGIIMTIISLIASTLMNSMGNNTAGLGIGIGIAIIIPIIYGAIGFISGAVGAFIYNLAAKWVGGLEIDLEK
jgi:hypothetical protein